LSPANGKEYVKNLFKIGDLVMPTPSAATSDAWADVVTEVHAVKLPATSWGDPAEVCYYYSLFHDGRAIQYPEWELRRVHE
jgi:hypothetical protein